MRFEQIGSAQIGQVGAEVEGRLGQSSPIDCIDASKRCSAWKCTARYWHDRSHARRWPVSPEGEGARVSMTLVSMATDRLYVRGRCRPFPWHRRCAPCRTMALDTSRSGPHRVEVADAISVGSSRMVDRTQGLGPFDSKLVVCAEPCV